MILLQWISMTRVGNITALKGVGQKAGSATSEVTSLSPASTAKHALGMGDVLQLPGAGFGMAGEQSDTFLIFTLTLLYLLVVCVAGFQLVRILWFGHAICSFQCGFVLLCLVWGLLRVVFLLHPSRWPDVLTLFLFWLPLDLQFSTFSLLGVFLANLLYSHEWQLHKRRFFCVCIASNICIVSMTMLVIGLGHSAHAYVLDVERKHHLYITLLFSCLTLAYGTGLVVAVRLSRRMKLPSSPIPVTHVLFTILASFCLLASRTLYHLLAWQRLLQVPVSSYSWHVDALSLWLLILWEIIPSFSVLLYFRHIAKTSIKGPFSACLACFWLRDCWTQFTGGMTSMTPSTYSGSPFYPFPMQTTQYQQQRLSFLSASPGNTSQNGLSDYGSEENLLLNQPAQTTQRGYSFMDYDGTNYDTSPSGSDGDTEWTAPDQRRADRVSSDQHYPYPNFQQRSSEPHDFLPSYQSYHNARY
eukprot:g51699.t1